MTRQKIQSEKIESPQARSCPSTPSCIILNCPFLYFFFTKLASHHFVWTGAVSEWHGVLRAGEEPGGHPRLAHPLLHGRGGRALPPHRHQVLPRLSCEWRELISNNTFRSLDNYCEIGPVSSFGQNQWHGQSCRHMVICNQPCSTEPHLYLQSGDMIFSLQFTKTEALLLTRHVAARRWQTALDSGTWPATQTPLGQQPSAPVSKHKRGEKSFSQVL